MIIFIFVLAAVIIEFAFLFIVRPDILMQMQNFISRIPGLSGGSYDVDDFVMKHRFVFGIILIIVGIILVGEGIHLSTKRLNSSFFDDVSQDPMNGIVLVPEKKPVPVAENKAEKAIYYKKTSKFMRGQIDYVEDMFKDELQGAGGYSQTSQQADEVVSEDVSVPEDVQSIEDVDTSIEDKDLLKYLQQTRQQSSPEPSQDEQGEQESDQPPKLFRETIQDKELLEYIK